MSHFYVIIPLVIALWFFNTCFSVKCYNCDDVGYGPCFEIGSSQGDETVDKCEGNSCYRLISVNQSQIRKQSGCSPNSTFCNDTASILRDIKYCAVCEEDLCNLTPVISLTNESKYLILVSVVIYLNYYIFKQ